jgi:hypothetical protein
VNSPLPVLADGISAVWALPSEAGRPAAPRTALADGCAYLLFGFDAAHAGRRDLIHARLIGPRTRPFLIDERPRLCVGVRFVPGFAQAAFGLPASELLDQRVEYDLVYPNADADLERISAARTDAERVAGILALALRGSGRRPGFPPACVSPSPASRPPRATFASARWSSASASRASTSRGSSPRTWA